MKIIFGLALLLCVTFGAEPGKLLLLSQDKLYHFCHIILSFYFLSMLSSFTIKSYILRPNLHQTCFNDLTKCEMVHETNFSLSSAK